MTMPENTMASLRSEEIINKLRTELEEKEINYQECRSQLRLAHTQLRYKDMALQGIINSNVNLHEKMTELNGLWELKESHQREIQTLKEEMLMERRDFTKQLIESRNQVESLTNQLECKDQNHTLAITESFGEINEDDKCDLVKKLLKDILTSINDNSTTTMSSSTENLQDVLRSLDSFLGSTQHETIRDIFNTIASFIGRKVVNAEKLDQKKEIDEIEMNSRQYNQNNDNNHNVGDTVTIENPDEEIAAAKKRARRRRRRQNEKARKWAEKSEAVDTPSAHHLVCQTPVTV